MYYRIRTKSTINGCTVVIVDNIPSLKEAYEIIVSKGKGTARKFYIDEVSPKLFSKLSAREAEKRLQEQTYLESMNYERCYFDGEYVQQNCADCPYKEDCSGSKEEN